MTLATRQLDPITDARHRFDHAHRRSGAQSSPLWRRDAGGLRDGASSRFNAICPSSKQLDAQAAGELHAATPRQHLRDIRGESLLSKKLPRSNVASGRANA